LSAPEELTRLIREEQARSRLPSLSAAAFRGHEVVWADAVGIADLEREVEATPETQYRVGSITKTVTAAAIMVLRDEGRLALDDPLGRHVPDVAHAEPTLRRLLSHLSGLQREFPDGMWERMEDPPREELLSSVAEAEQVLEPGAHWHYSNLAFALLGEVVERSSGQRWEDFVSERFLGPLGLAKTTLEAEEPRARGYFVQPYVDVTALEADLLLRRTAAAGQLWSTTGDLARWGSFLADPDPAILAPATAKEMHAVQVMAEPERWLSAWGLGLELYRRGDVILAGHSGGMPGFLAQLTWSRDGVGSVVLANSSTWPELQEFGISLAERAIELFPAEGEVWRPEGAAPPAEVSALLGRWWIEGNEFVLRYWGGRLEARMASAPDWLPPAVFEPDGGDRFRVASGRERGELVRVVRDDAGEPVKLYWATYPCTRAPEVWGSSK
jgi:CubicO group peptidase (beta-lactamase class C family)